MTRFVEPTPAADLRTDHNRNTEDLLAALADLMHTEDKLTEEVRLARRRRALARKRIAVRLAAARTGPHPVRPAR